MLRVRNIQSSLPWYTASKYIADGAYPSLICDFENDRYYVNGFEKTFSQLFTFTRSSSATRVNSSGIIETLSSDIARRTYNPATGACEGLLIEGSIANMQTYSGDTSNAVYVHSGLTVTGNSTTAPDGTLAGALHLETATSALHIIRPSSVAITAGDTVTASIFIKKYSSRNMFYFRLTNSSDSSMVHINYNIDDNTFYANPVAATGGWSISAYGSQRYPNGWTRVWVTVATVTDTAFKFSYAATLNWTSVATYNGSTSEGFYSWGMQIERQALCTSYIPTTTAAVTRTSDVCKNSAANTVPMTSWFNATNSSLFADYYSASQAGVSVGSVFQDAAPTVEAIAIVHNLSSVQGFTTTSSTTTYSPTRARVSNYVPFTRTKYALTVKTSDCAITCDNQTVGTSTTNTMPSSLDAMYIGNRSLATYTNGPIRDFRCYPTRMTNSEMQRITA